MEQSMESKSPIHRFLFPGSDFVVEMVSKVKCGENYAALNSTRLEDERPDAAVRSNTGLSSRWLHLHSVA